MASKMHELLAVEDDVIGLSNRIIDETLHTFKNKASEFYMGQNKVYKPLDEADKDLLPPTTKEIIDSVPAKLKYTFSKVKDEYDLLLQKEATNQRAVADLTVNGEILATDVPVNFLLTLERRLEKIRNVLLEAPTLPNGPEWVEDTQRGEGFFKLKKAQISYRTKKEKQWPIVVPATKEHPAQTKETEVTSTIGTYEEMLYDSRMTSHDKAVLLERLDMLVKEVKKAVRRANQIDVVDREIGSKLFSFLLNGK